MLRRPSLPLIAVALIVLPATPALACGGLLGPNGEVNLLRTATLAAYHEGVEHYVTAFEFAGGRGSFGSIVPLPGIPSKVVKGGDWTLQRLQQEVAPPVARAVALESADTAAGSAEVIEEKQIGALDVTILKGGGDEVGRWAEENGFRLPPDAPEVLDFYAARSPIFMAARFDVARARDRGVGAGDATPVHLAIPTPNPWVPLRILGLGKQAAEVIEADVFLLTDRPPALLPAPSEERGLLLDRSQEASPSLLADLRSDRGMEWLPEKDMWLTYLKVQATAGQLTHDLAIDATGENRPSPVAAGLRLPDVYIPSQAPSALVWLIAAALGAGAVLVTNRVVDAR